MAFAPWQQVPLHTPIDAFLTGAVLLYDDEDAYVFSIKPGTPQRGEKFLVTRMQHLDGKRSTKERKKGTLLTTVAHELLVRDSPEGGEPRAMALPAVLWQQESALSARNVVAVTASAITLALMMMAGGLESLYSTWMLSSLPALLVRHLWKPTLGIDVLASKELGITLETVHPYALAREQGQLWVPPTPGADRRELIRQRVDAIRSAYMELREDVVYRIESPALFDPAVPATAEFEAALVAFEDADMTAEPDQLDELASEVEVTFNVAQANAERLGLEHFPEDARADARRASKAARLAVGATTDGERTASLRHVQRILDSLSLYYLPKQVDRLAIERGPEG